jgi:hypothetical protein|tara:strand:+ start:1263 stop:2912 length:1650 start_codon:yes stop_codon:yes gene_type:complete
MIRKVVQSILFLIIIFPIYSQNEIDSLFTKLDNEISKQKTYDNAKELKINNIKNLLSDKNLTPENKYFLINKLISEYEYYSFDSSLHYIEENLAFAEQLGNTHFIKESTLRLAKLLATSGRYDESMSLLKELNPPYLPQDLIREYYTIYKRCYLELRNISRIKSIRARYNTLYFAYKDSLNIQISNLNKSSKLHLEVTEQNFRDVFNTKKALEINAKRLAMSKIGTREYALVAYNRALSSEIDGNRINQKKFLILSAISDIQSSVKDNASMANLAAIFFEEGDIEKAHDYINFSFEDAKFYNSKLRFLDISNVLPIISKSYETINLRQSNKLKKQLIFISILSLIAIVALFFIFKQYRKIKLGREHLKTANLQLKDLNEKLSFTNSDLKRLYEELSAVDTIKEQYIGTFLNLYSEYIDKLNVYRKTVKKYIITNRTKDLLELTKSKKIVEDELKIFYDNFDKSFLHIYPNFIKNLNALLKEDERIVVKEEILNTELRIYALIRLGITNSAKIAKILRYSVNTIYNYRVKIKNSALNRDEFDELVKRITN